MQIAGLDSKAEIKEIRLHAKNAQKSLVPYAVNSYPKIV